jgi:hypothetical protein
MNRKTYFVPAMALGYVLFLTSCGSNKTEEGTHVTDTTAQEVISDSNRVEATKQIMYSIPSSAETADLLKEAGASYDIKLMNDVNNTDKYNVLRSQALNLGIFGADLNYANVFEKSMEVQLYMESCQSLVKKLDIEGAISENVWDRLEENKDNRDSLNSIISEVFFDLDTYLEENDKTEISGLIVAGGWLEGLYIATQMVNEKKPNQMILDRVAEQKLSLENLCKLMESYKGTDNIKMVRDDLNKLKQVYEKIEISREKGETTTNNGVTTIGGKNNIKFPKEVFVELKTLTKQIRDAYVKV